MIYGIAIICSRSGRHYFSKEHVVGFGIPGESGLTDAINFAGMIFALDCNCKDLQFSERHQQPLLRSVQTAERTLLVRHHFAFPVMAAVVAPPSTPLQLLGEFAVEMLQAWVTQHAPSDPCGVPKRGFKNTYLAVLRSLVARHVDATFQAFGPMISWMMVARSNGTACLFASALLFGSLMRLQVLRDCVMRHRRVPTPHPAHRTQRLRKHLPSAFVALIPSPRLL